MPNIRPVSDLRNYSEVLRDISVDEPVFLTKNGRGRYAYCRYGRIRKNQGDYKAYVKATRSGAVGEKTVNGFQERM